MNTQIIELLENRIAPASVLKFTDVDGDKVKIISSVGDLNAAGVATFDMTGHQLISLSLLDASFKGASIKTVVQKSADGDGLVNIGRIDALTNDLGKVVIKGDLGLIICGDGDAATGPGLKLLSVFSMGIYGTATQGGGSLGGVVEGSLGTLLIRGDMLGATMGARNFTDTSDGKIGKIVIGGSVAAQGGTGGGIFATGDIGSLTIGGDLIGGDSGSSGEISANGKVHSLKIAGSIIGGGGFFSGVINASELGIAKIGGNLEGGTASASGAIISDKIGKLTIGGSVNGGRGDLSFISNMTPVQGQIISLGDVDSIKIAGDMVGRDGKASGTIQALGDVGSISIAGSLVGGKGDGSGKIDVFGDLTKLTIGSAVVGGNGRQDDVVVDGLTHEGQVYIGGSLKSATIGGGVFGGNGAGTGEIRTGGDMDFLKIDGNLVGSMGLGSGQVAAGKEMGKLLINGDVIGGSMLFAGYISVGAQTHSLTIAGSLIGGSSNWSGNIQASGSIESLKIGGNIVGGNISGTQGDLDTTALIRANRIDSMLVGGSIIAGIDSSSAGQLLNNAGIRVTNDIEKLVIKGSIVGNQQPDGTTLVTISARGQATPGTTSDIAIGSLQVGGRVELANILAGFDQDDPVTSGSNGNASIGTVKVGGNWIASNLTAGIQDGGDPGFGTEDDVIINIPPGAATDAIIARIASIAIKGLVIGTPATDTTNFGFTAQQIGSFKSLGFTASLTSGTDAPISLSPTTADVTIREL